jgi:hypothetical protein
MGATYTLPHLLIFHAQKKGARHGFPILFTRRRPGRALARRFNRETLGHRE